jgi:DNA-binding HxlR family transcriptional regulator
VGDRWTLLIIGELLLRGPSRFTDIKNGLPGIATNLLSSRLGELERNGLITRDRAQAPVASNLYGLTDNGRALESTLRQLGSWGLQFMTDERHGEIFAARR